MINDITVSRHEDNLHITIENSTSIIQLTQGFTYLENTVTAGGMTIPCSAQQYKKLKKLYHKALKKDKSPHAIWGSTVFSVAFLISFCLLILGLSSHKDHVDLSPEIQQAGPQAESSHSTPEFPFSNG
jgi:hypothetical protein